MKKLKNNTLMIFGILILIVIIIIIATLVILYNRFEKSSTILNGVYIKDVSVSKLEKDEAKVLLDDYLTSSMSDEVILEYSNYEFDLEIEQIDAMFDIDGAVNYAYNIGRSGGFFKNIGDILNASFSKINIDPELMYDGDALNSYIDFLEVSLPCQVENPSYYIEDGKIIFTTGSKGAGISRETLKDMILNAIQDNSYSESIFEIPTYETYPDPMDFDEVYSEVYSEVSDAYYTTEPYAIYAENIGVDFDLDEVKNEVTEFGTDEEYSFNIDYTYPKVTVDDLGMDAFPDMLATYSTAYVNNRDRTTNLILASNKINGTVLMPGDTFSFNSVVGPRTEEKGYKTAAVYIDGSVGEDVGGGICQVVTTLYNAAVRSDLEITDRCNHMFVPTYSNPGYDATVYYGSQDFKFVNSRDYPIKIVSSVKNGYVTVSIYGLKEENEYDIKIETNLIKTIPKKTAGGYTGYVVDSYKVYRLNGEVVKKEKIARDTYSAS